jgi:RND family efflux transporter MFP subunit
MMAMSVFEHAFRTVRWRTVSFAGALLLIVGAAACSGSGATPAGGGPGGGRGPAMAVPVEMVTLAESPIEQIGEFVGTIKSRRSMTIQPQAEGFLLRILVKSGDRVQAGSPMFEIDAAPLQAGIAALESMRAAREADAKFARQQAERAKKLLTAGAMSQQEYDQAQAGVQAAEAQLKAAEEQIRQQRTELSYARVTAPAAGIVGDVPVRQGDRVTRQTVLTTVEDNTGLEVYVQVPVQDAPRLKIGLPVRLVDETGQPIVSEKVTFISPSVDDSTQTVLVKTTLPGLSSRFRSDQFVRAQIVFEKRPGITAPVVAFNRINGQYFVFVAEAGEGGKLIAKQRAVTVGPVLGNNYIVRGGLKAGDKLITSGIQKIGDGVPVQTLPAGAGGPGGGPPGAGAAPAGGGKGK